MKEKLEDATIKLVKVYENLYDNDNVETEDIHRIVGAIHLINKIYKNIYGE